MYKIYVANDARSSLQSYYVLSNVVIIFHAKKKISFHYQTEQFMKKPKKKQCRSNENASIKQIEEGENRTRL